AENSDDVLQILVALENGLHATRDGVMLSAYDARIENARVAGEGIDRRVDAALDDLAAEVRGRIQVRERRSRRGIGVVVGGQVNCLHGSDRTALSGGDALLQSADFCVEVRLIADRRRHAAEQRRNLGAGLHETEDVVDEEKHVEVLLVAEVFGNREAGQADAEARPGRLRHLAVDERGSRFFGIAGNDNAGFLELEPKVVAFTGAFTHAGKDRHAAVLHRDVVNQFLNENGLADAGAAEEADLAALQEGLNEVDNFDAGLEHLERGGLLF